MPQISIAAQSRSCESSQLPLFRCARARHCVARQRASMPCSGRVSLSVSCQRNKLSVPAAAGDDAFFFTARAAPAPEAAPCEPAADAAPLEPVVYETSLVWGAQSPPRPPCRPAPSNLCRSRWSQYRPASAGNVNASP